MKKTIKNTLMFNLKNKNYKKDKDTNFCGTTTTIPFLSFETFLKVLNYLSLSVNSVIVSSSVSLAIEIFLLPSMQ